LDLFGSGYAGLGVERMVFGPMRVFQSGFGAWMSDWLMPSAQAREGPKERIVSLRDRLRARERGR